MKKMNKIFALGMLIPTLFSLASCGGNGSDDDAIVLNVYNCADYIAEDDEEEGTVGVLTQFEEYCLATYGKKVEIKYSTYETNEDLYNQLKAGGVQYDLVCPSEYMIGKMIQNDMLEPLTGNIENYELYGSNYIKSVFDTITETTKSTGVSHTFHEYTVPYMWGTMGYMYDPENITDEQASSWNLIWDTEHANESSLKDSVRDSYAVAALYVYSEELNLIKGLVENGTLTKEEYNAKVTEIMNRCDDKSLALIGAALKEAKNNVYEFEVDTGKENIIKGKYYANLCWSGDAVYAMDTAEEEDFIINYMVPSEGSNVWFDGWCMPKGANVEWAQRLMNFLCDPSIAAQNMEYIGYTSAIAGQEIWELACEWYDSDDASAEAYDITYFFEGTGIVDSEDNPMTSFVIHTTEKNRQLYAQYPDEETISRCAVMKDFGAQNEKVNSMWISVKGNNVSWVILVFIAVIVLFVVLFEVKSAINSRARKHRAKAK